MGRPDYDYWMRRCLELAQRAAGHAAPNPMVGCVILDSWGRVVAEGAHRRPGTAHAEAVALAQLRRRGESARGYTVYTNLEPCHHKRNRRTAPCSLALAEAGIGEVVIGVGDPIKSHAGGARYLAAQGVRVVRGVLRAECVHLNRDFFTWARTGLPHVVLKAAMTLDGRIATHTGESRWITGEAARAHAHRQRARWQAIMVGVGTVLADDPALTARGVHNARDPVRVVADSQLRTPPTARLLPANAAGDTRVIVACTADAPEDRAVRLADAGAEVWRLPAAPSGPVGRVDLAALLRRLGKHEITSVMVEGGGDLHAAMLAGDLADELILYVAPVVFGGRGASAGLSWVGGDGAARILDAPRYAFARTVERAGDDLVITLRRPRRRPSGDGARRSRAG